MKAVRVLMFLAVCLPVTVIGAGCVNPLSMGFATPIPVPPWVPDRMEEKYCFRNDHRTPIMPAIPPGHRPLCEDVPDKAAVLRAMPRVTRGIPYIYEEHREDIDVVVEKLADHIDPPRFFPLIGPAQLHHCHWKATVFYTEVFESYYPFPYRCRRRRSEVVYLDRDHLHVVACTPEQAQILNRGVVSRFP